MNLTSIYKPVEDYIVSQSTITLLFYVAIIVFIIYIVFFQKKKKTLLPKDVQNIKEGLNKLEVYDDKSNENLRKHLIQKKQYILSQARTIKLKHQELLKANETLKRKYNQVQQQLKIISGEMENGTNQES